MNTLRTKLVHCGAITYVYRYESSKNITAFSFENEAVQLNRSLLLNFAEDYVGSSFTLHLDQDFDLSEVEQRLHCFLSKIARHGIQYIAVLDLNPAQSCIHLLTNRSNNRTNEQLTAIWGATAIKDRISLKKLLVRYATAVENTSLLTTPVIFSSDQLKKPCVLHNHAADNFLYTNERITSYDFEVYEIIDEHYGTITVTEYQTYFY
ncbi:hypothetical protein [Lysinibacillus fusiformis]|uniref:hypothetical protein n=1 Tax=Lysinibacillus fusiformis TaxID=28031 RepID=UPI003D010F24